MENQRSGAKIIDSQVLKKLFVFLRPYRSAFYLLILLTILLGILGPVQPYLVQRTIDQYIVHGDYEGLARMAILLMTLLAVQVIVQYFNTYLSDWLGQQVVKDIRIQVYAHIIRLKASFSTKTPVGRLVTRNISDTETLADVFSQGMAALVGDLLQLLFIIILMFYINWRLALASLITLPLLIVLTYRFKTKIKTAFGELRNAVAALNAFVQARITGMTVVQIFNREQQEFEKFRKLNEDHQKASIQSVLYYAFYFPLIAIVNSVSVSLLIWYGAKEVMHGTTSFGDLVAFLMYIQLFFRPLHLIADRFNTLQMGIVSTDRIVKLLENDEQLVNKGTYRPKSLQGEVIFQNIWFAYEQGHYALKDISFHLEAQKSLAIVGATGAGKSTIINLIERFYDVQKGEIKIDGINIMDYDLAVLRKHVGLALQDVFLFSASIYENITLGNLAISKEQVVQAAKLIGIHDFILQLPGGYDYNVMERGMTLSMGQRQLLAFARVLVYDPRILILDESTSSMDTATEALIQKATAMLMQNRTCILIAHRLSTVQYADKILVLKHGEIQEQGTHRALLAQGGYYAALYKAM